VEKVPNGAKIAQERSVYSKAETICNLSAETEEVTVGKQLLPSEYNITSCSVVV
jgi:hypothetical protein